MADGESAIANLATGEDVASTRAAIEALGVSTRAAVDGRVVVDGHGVDALARARRRRRLRQLRHHDALPRRRTARVVRFAPCSSAIRRCRRGPWRRVLDPLRAMGADVSGRAGGNCAPARDPRRRARAATRHELAVACGQVKTALVLAGLQAEGVTEIVEPAPSARPHRAAAPVPRRAGRGGRRPSRPESDAGAPQRVHARHPRRPVVGRVLRGRGHAGARLAPRDRGRPREPGPPRVPRRAARDGRSDRGHTEAAIAAASRWPTSRSSTHRSTAPPFTAKRRSSTSCLCSRSRPRSPAASTEIRDAAELRVKESDRIATLAVELNQLGAAVEELDDGLRVTGRRRGCAGRGGVRRSRGPPHRDGGRRGRARAPRRLVRGGMGRGRRRPIRSSRPISRSSARAWDDCDDASSPSTGRRAPASRRSPAASRPGSGSRSSTPARCIAPSPRPRSSAAPP